MFKWLKKLWQSYTIETPMVLPDIVINNTQFTNELMAEVFPEHARQLTGTIMTGSAMDLGGFYGGDIANPPLGQYQQLDAHTYGQRLAQQQSAMVQQQNAYQQQAQANQLTLYQQQLYGVNNYQELQLYQGLIFQAGSWQEFTQKKLTITECIEIMEKAIWSSKKSPITKKDIL